MNEHYFQKTFRKVTGIIGYIAGALLSVISLFMVFIDFDNWSTYIIISALGMIISFIADIILASNARAELLMSIMKRQEAIFRQMNQSSRNNSSSDMHPLDLLRKLKTKRDDDDDFIGKAISISMNPDGDMKINGEKPPEELLDILNKISEKLKNAFEEDAGKSMNEMSTEELNEKLDEAIKKEDYNRASLIRDEISKRNSDDENKSS